MEQRLKSRYYFSKMVNQATIKVDYAKYEKDISLKGEFIRTIRALECSDIEKSKMIKMGISAIVGKEVGM